MEGDVLNFPVLGGRERKDYRFSTRGWVFDLYDTVYVSTPHLLVNACLYRRRFHRVVTVSGARAATRVEYPHRGAVTGESEGVGPRMDKKTQTKRSEGLLRHSMDYREVL